MLTVYCNCNPMSGTFGTEDLEYEMNRPFVSADTGRRFGSYSQKNRAAQ